MEKIYWVNKITYTKLYVEKCKSFLGKIQMLPLYKNEYSDIVTISKKNNLNLAVLLSLRNLMKIQLEIISSKTNKNRVKDIVMYNFKKFIKKSNSINNTNTVSELVVKFYAKCNLPLNKIAKIIKINIQFISLPNNIKDIFLQPLKDLHDETKESTTKAQMFEKTFEKWLLTNINTKFITEKEIRLSNNYSVTPDFLFNEPILINVNNCDYKIKWIDVKNYSYINVPFISISLKNQYNKYNSTFGNGCFIFKNGFQSDGLTNILMLDGSFLNKYI